MGRLSLTVTSSTAETVDYEVEQVYNKHFPVHVLKDSKCLFDLISKGYRASEKRVVLDISDDSE